MTRHSNAVRPVAVHSNAARCSQGHHGLCRLSIAFLLLPPHFFALLIVTKTWNEIAMSWIRFLHRLADRNIQYYWFSCAHFNEISKWIGSKSKNSSNSLRAVVGIVRGCTRFTELRVSRTLTHSVRALESTESIRFDYVSVRVCACVCAPTAPCEVHRASMWLFLDFCFRRKNETSIYLQMAKRKIVFNGQIKKANNFHTFFNWNLRRCEEERIPFVRNSTHPVSHWSDHYYRIPAFHLDEGKNHIFCP